MRSARRIVLLASLLLVRPLEGAESAEQTRYCGVGCVYGVLRLHGHAVAMADIEKRIDSLAPGTPLERLNVKQLRETIESFGLHAASVRFRASEYANVPPNTILFLRPDKVGGQGVGHVVLLLSVTEEGVVHFVDFTPGVGRKEVSLDQLRTFWDGEAIVVSAKRVTPFWKYAQIVLGVGLLLGAVLMLVRLRRGRPAVNCKK